MAVPEQVNPDDLVHELARLLVEGAQIVRARRQQGGRPMAITVNGARTDLDAFMEREMYKATKHNNIVALIATADGVEARVITKWRDLLDLPPTTPCIQSWQGNWSSDMFVYRAGDVQVRQTPAPLTRAVNLGS